MILLATRMAYDILYFTATSTWSVCSWAYNKIYPTKSELEKRLDQIEEELKKMEELEKKLSQKVIIPTLTDDDNSEKQIR